MQAEAINRKADEELLVMQADWERLLHAWDDSLLDAVTDTFITAQSVFPTLSEFVNELQVEARIRARGGLPVTTDPPHRESLGDAHVAAKAIRLALHHHLTPARDFAEMRGRAETMDLPESAAHGPLLDLRTQNTRGHDHRNGAHGCPVCSLHGPLEPGPADYAWSGCRGCDGSGWVTLDVATNTVRPCEHCRPEQHERWAMGHYEPGHTCEECSPTRRRRAS